MMAEILDNDLSSRGVFRQHSETDDLDASLLLPIMGFLPPSDKRIRATVLAIADELTQDGLVLHYRVEGTDTGFEGEEGTLTICSFWLVTALAMIGETDRARALCQKLLSFAGPLQLYAEEIDTATGQHLGNSRRRSSTWPLSRPCRCSSSPSRSTAHLWRRKTRSVLIPLPGRDQHRG
jgi:alpha,alpha-trehalase